MNWKSFVVPGFMLLALTASAQAGSLEAYSAVIGGSNTACIGTGGVPAAISSYFPSAGDFGLLTPNPGGNSISDCGLSGSISDLTSTTGPVTSTSTLATTPYSSYPANSVYGSSSATASYGSVSIATSTTLTGVQGPNGEGESAAFGIVSDTLSVACTPSCTTGFMAFDFTLTGSVSLVSGDTGGGVMELEAEAGGNANESIFYGSVQGTSASATGVTGQAITGCSTASGSFTCTGAVVPTLEMPVTFSPAGVAFSFGIIGETSLGINQTDTVDPPDMTLSGIQVYDAQGNQISSFTITGDSGSTYGADGFESGPPTSAPEPGTLFSLTLGLILLLTGGQWVKLSNRQLQKGNRPE